MLHNLTDWALLANPMLFLLVMESITGWERTSKEWMQAKEKMAAWSCGRRMRYG
jgi:hypothetical protein